MREIPGDAKPVPPFAGAPAAVRRALRSEILYTPADHRIVATSPPQIIGTLLDRLSRAA